MGNKIGRAIKVDEDTLRRKSGFYASVLVEVDLENYIPSKIVVESKYGKFEQCIQIPKLPKYCIHCKNIGHYMAECRIQRKNQPQEVQHSEVPKNFWKKKATPPTVEFDICNPPKEKGQETPKSVWKVENSVKVTTQPSDCDNYFPSCSNLDSRNNHEDDDITLVVPPLQNITLALNKEKGLLVHNVAESETIVNAPSDTSLTTDTIISEGWKEVPRSIAKFKNAQNNFNSGKYFASPSKFQVLVDVAEKQQHTFSKVISKHVKGKLVKPNMITRKQANNSVKSNSNLGEPKIKVSSSILKSLNLSEMSKMVIHNSNDSRKGNIWLFWNLSLSRPVVISSSNQAITVQVGDVMVTGIHAACLTVDGRELWEDLFNIIQRDCPWMIIGDFNVVLSYEEKIGGRRPLRISMQEFRNCLESCNLIQATRTGIKYSWCNNIAGKKRILCDINKAFYNLKWLEKFDGWSYKVGVRGTLDHGPLFGSTVNICKPTNAPFRYQNIWTSHPGFLDVIKDAWNEEILGNPSFSFMSKLKRLKSVLKKWNWEIFGDLRVKMKITEDQVLAATLLSDADPENTVLLNNLVTTRSKEEIISKQYNELMRDKSRIKRVKKGGANTYFFHASIKIRQCHNNITENGEHKGQYNY
ncbi:uncharacterized protein LOC113315391 [Papaver somniferum]|uniref:uncharacterized protein LOC113315391 n=1 Tax=Papaver somniferum TaxID=3469 RepID=UPI000E6F7B4C|nr:uncharacterized protein LOC113315391 [Papaver somniferum]